MKLSRRSMSVVLPFAVMIAALPVFPLACSDEDCTTGTVGLDLSFPSDRGAAFVDVSFEVAGTSIHKERLQVAPGAGRVSADIALPGGYPAGQTVLVTAVAKRLDGNGEVAVATWFTLQAFPSGCVAFVASLFPADGSDAGDFDGGFFFDGAVVDAPALPDADLPDGAGPDADLGDAALDATAADAATDAGEDAPNI